MDAIIKLCKLDLLPRKNKDYSLSQQEGNKANI